MKPVTRKLYDGEIPNGVAAKYTIEIDSDVPGEVALRVYDIACGDALVYLRPAKALMLARDLKRFAERAGKAGK